MGRNQRTKGGKEITQMMNGHFIFKANIRSTLLFSMDIAFRESLLNMVSKTSPVLLIFPELIAYMFMCVNVCWFVRGYKEQIERGRKEQFK